ncbi:MAG: hypothetical protein EBR75_06965, partial [Actinobacteria bacterium]|nr:hypothetical protein [Actinomycetota bacterium]
CGLIPLIGHFIGCTIVTLVALTQSVTIGVVAFLIPYALSIRYMKPAPPVPVAPPPKTMTDARGFY